MSARRLTVVDDIFYRDHVGRGPVSVMQGLWRFDERLDPDEVRPIVAGLVDSPLTRRVHTSAVPGARRAFVDGARAVPLRVDPHPVEPDDVVGWGDRAATAALDVVHGPTWEMALVHIAGGGSVVALTCSHLVADGLGLVSTVDAALPHRVDSPNAAADHGPRSSRVPTFLDDLRDALVVWWTVIVGVVAAVASAFVDPAVRRELIDSVPRRRNTDTSGAGTTTPNESRGQSVVFDVDPERFASVASGHDGSRTALLVAVIAEVALATSTHRPVEIAVPVSVPGAPLGSAVLGVDDRDAARDLPALTAQIAEVVAAVRGPADPDRARRATERRNRSPRPTTVVGPPGGMPPELLQVVGDRAARAVTADAGAGDALASNLGTLPGVFERLGPHVARALAVRAVRCGPDGALAPNTVGLWSGVACGRLTLSASAPASESVLADLLMRALQSWGLAAERW